MKNIQVFLSSWSLVLVRETDGKQHVVGDRCYEEK